MDLNRVFIRQTLHKLLPSSIIGEVACFVFYDHHPRDKSLNLDVTVCTNNGEVMEYCQRELISSLLLESLSEVKEIKIFRNSKCELFYLLVIRDEIIILSRKEDLKVLNRVQNVETYSIEDVECTGQASLKIIRNDDAVPLVFDDDFKRLTHIQIEKKHIQSEESLLIVKQLMKKLTEAKYTTRHNEQKYENYVQLRQTAAFSLFQKNILVDSAPKLSRNKISNLLQVSVKPPMVKMCNKKVVIVIDLKNNNCVPIKDVCILLNSESKQSIEHTTKVFENTTKPPCWKEKDAKLNSYSENTVVAVVDLKELQFDVASRIEFEIAVSFTKNDKNYLLPVESVSISPLDVMGENFDILFCGDDPSNVILSILATSECFDLRLRHIKSHNHQHKDNVATLSDIFHTHLKMDRYLDNVAIHRDAPFHILYGVMVVFNDNVKDTDIMNVQVYTRFPSQVLALMHYMYDTVPYRIIATTSEYKITAINNNLANYNENSQTIDQINYTGCATSILNQIKMIKDYLNDCTLKMTEDRNPETQDKIGKEVDLLALGVPRYLEFRNKILEESLKGIKNISLEEDPLGEDDDMDCVVIE